MRAPDMRSSIAPLSDHGNGRIFIHLPRFSFMLRLRNKVSPRKVHVNGRECMISTREGELCMPRTHGRYDYASIPRRLDDDRKTLTAGVVPR